MNKDKLIESIGWIGAQLLAFCGLPAVIQVVSQGHAEGYSPGFIAMWGIGEVLTLAYVFIKYKNKPLMVNYIANIVFISIIAIYMII